MDIEWKDVMILLATVLVYIIVTAVLWKTIKDKELSLPRKIGLGVLYGVLSCLATLAGIDSGLAIMNLRNLGPLISGMFFDPVSGIAAGVIGAVFRYIYGVTVHTDYTTFACALATLISGFFPLLFTRLVIRERRPQAISCFFVGAISEVMHMYIIFLTFQENVDMAYLIVKMIAPTMIIYTSLTMTACAVIMKKLDGEKLQLFVRRPKETVSVTDRFQYALLMVTLLFFAFNMIMTYSVNTRIATENAEMNMIVSLNDLNAELNDPDQDYETVFSRYTDGFYFMINDKTKEVYTPFMGEYIFSKDDLSMIEKYKDTGKSFVLNYYDVEKCLCIAMTSTSMPDQILLKMSTFSEAYNQRDRSLMETTFSSILILSILYVAISRIVEYLVGRNLKAINKSLHEITEGNLNEVVEVRTSPEFSELSDDINQTVDALKGYIEAAEKRMEDELMFAATIQDAALPKNFRFSRDDFDLFALMDPAKEVGGDFYDFFFIDDNQFALVIADVSGKGIPAALFMMRAKTAIRSLAESGNEPSEIFYRANNSLCDGNDAKMFVTAWIGIIDLRTGEMKCSNAGHEYPVIKRADGKWELLKDKHGLVLAAMEDVPMKQYEMKLNPGDRLFVYTDGVPEAINEKTEQYGTDRLVKALNSLTGKTMEELLPEVRKDVSKYVGHADQFDDITMLGFTWNGPEE